MTPPDGPVWLVAFPAARRLRRTHQPPGVEPVRFDTRIVCADFEGLARTVSRLEADGIPTQLLNSRRGVPYAVVPGRQLRWLAQEEPDTWSVATASLCYVFTIHREALERLTWVFGAPTQSDAEPPAVPLPQPSADYLKEYEG